MPWGTRGTRSGRPTWRRLRALEVADARNERAFHMRRWLVGLGLALLIGAGGMLAYRALDEPGRHARYEPGSSPGWRGIRDQRSGGWRDERPNGRDGRSARSGALSGLRLFEIVVDLLNVAVGIVGIWLAVIGVRMQRAADRRMPARPDA